MQSPDEHLVFSNTIEVLFRKTLAAHLTAGIEARVGAFKAAGHRVTVELGARDGLACQYAVRFS